MLISKLKASAKWKKLPLKIREHSIFKNIKYINKPFPEMGLPDCYEKCENDFDGKPSYIGFSSNGINGFWDIATMSMRGVCSCMHWENTHSCHLVGSVTDPFLGIVYISDNTLTPYGISFRRRSLVRLVRSPNSKQYRILLERVYKDTGNTNPMVYDNRDDYSLVTQQVFKKFLQNKVGDKYNVITFDERERGAYGEALDFIPRPSSLDYLDAPNLSMSDCRINYGRINEAFAEKFAKQN